MDEIYCKNINEVRREKKFLEKTLNVKISLKGKILLIKGDPLDEYETRLIIDAINTGFSARTAALLKSEDFVFEKLNIKDHTRRKDLSIVRGRLIGTRGKTKNTIQQISGCEIKIKDNVVGLIGPAESIEYAVTGVINLIKGTKQTNVYKYLERINTKRKTRTQNK